ncbi:hypothetical protein VP395_00205 [Mariniflexile soesokkakense]|uniref:Glyoxalase/fosfomycin resistance/dioxygenase domain-containing protein n=1 Tax=Mariniflexile soesokkakense TaxID=1343160 RepID=A0ABV0A5I3_9FLAO
MENTQSNPIGWFEIYVNNMPRAKKFYETMLQTTLDVLLAPTEESSLNVCIPFKHEYVWFWRRFSTYGGF